MITSSTTARKRIITGFAAVLGTALMAFEAMPAQAAPPPHAPAHGYRRKQQQNTNYRNTNNRRRHTPTRHDIDGDGLQNTRDPDMDGDGTPNNRDRDIDGDRIPNNRDSNNAYSARWARDSRGRYVRRSNNPVQRTVTGVMNRRTPAGYYRDRTGRLIRRRTTAKRTVYTRRPARPVRRVGDRDRDGIRNGRDRDQDGDGVRNRKDRFDRNPSRR